MYRVRKVKSYRPAREGKRFSFRRKDTDIFAEKIIFDQFVKGFNRFILVLKIMEPIKADRIVPAAFVFPMRCNPEFRCFVS
jgi:hypothetical protein